MVVTPRSQAMQTATHCFISDCPDTSTVGMKKIQLSGVRIPKVPTGNTTAFGWGDTETIAARNVAFVDLSFAINPYQFSIVRFDGTTTRVTYTGLGDTGWTGSAAMPSVDVAVVDFGTAVAANGYPFIEYGDAGSSTSRPLTGTVSVANGVTTGTGTSFLSELSAGDTIRLSSCIYKVTRIDSATSMAFVGSASNSDSCAMELSTASRET